MTKSRHLRRKETKPRVFRSSNGFYVIGGKKYSKLIGTREEVLAGIAYKTKGGLLEKDILVSENRNEKGKLVSRRMSVRSRKRSNLNKHNKEKKRKAALMASRRKKVAVSL